MVRIQAEVFIGQRMALLNIPSLILSFRYRFKPRDQLESSLTSKYTIAPDAYSI